MKRHCVAGLAAGVAIVAAGLASAQTPQSVDDLRVEARVSEGEAAPRHVRVRSWVSQTALWPGDEFTYSVELTCAPNVDVLVEDLAAEALALEGLRRVGSTRERRVEGGGLTYLVQHRLAADDLETTPRVGDQVVRYFIRRPGHRVEEAAPAGEVRVPGVSLALRSTLPDRLQALGIRDRRAEAPPSRVVTLARPLGVALIFLSGLPVALWGAPFARRLATRFGRLRERQAQSVTASVVEEIRALDYSSEPQRRTGFDRLDAALRQHLAKVGGIPAPALTAAEVAQRLPASGVGADADEIGAVLEECERARYGPAHRLPPAQKLEAGVALLGELLGRG